MLTDLACGNCVLMSSRTLNDRGMFANRCADIRPLNSNKGGRNNDIVERFLFVANDSYFPCVGCRVSLYHVENDYQPRRYAMYICLCNGITDKQVMQAVSDGAKTVSGVYKAHGCAPQCGKCACHIKDMIPSGISSGGSIAGALFKAADI